MLFCEIPPLTDTTDHALIVWFISLLILALGSFAIFVIISDRNKIHTLWDYHNAEKERKKANEKEFGELKEEFESLRSSLTELTKSMSHLEKAFLQSGQNAGVVNQNILDSLAKIEKKLNGQHS